MKIIEIEGSLTIERVGDIQEMLRMVLMRHSGASIVDIDLNKVTEFDGAGFQLLLACAFAIEKLGARLELHHIPEQIQKVIDRYDVAGVFVCKGQT